MKEMTKDTLRAAAMAALLTGLLTAVMLLVAGCRPAGGTAELAAEPVPAVETVAHGYETAEGAVVKYDDVETGKDSAKDGFGKDDYSGRATAK